MKEQIPTGQSFPKVFSDPNFGAGASPAEPTLLMAIADSETRNALAVIVKAFSLNARWVSSAQAASDLLDSGDFAACVCGFSLEGGTYPEVARYAKQQHAPVPVIMVSAPRPLNEYQDYLACMKVGAFDFICYPYEKIEVARILRRAMAARYASARAPLV
jgi:DNA-binding NtrC family response regulator